MPARVLARRQRRETPIAQRLLERCHHDLKDGILGEAAFWLHLLHDSFKRQVLIGVGFKGRIPDLAREDHGTSGSRKGQFESPAC